MKEDEERWFDTGSGRQEQGVKRRCYLGCGGGVCVHARVHAYRSQWPGKAAAGQPLSRTLPWKIQAVSSPFQTCRQASHTYRLSRPPGAPIPAQAWPVSSRPALMTRAEAACGVGFGQVPGAGLAPRPRPETGQGRPAGPEGKGWRCQGWGRIKAGGPAAWQGGSLNQEGTGLMVGPLSPPSLEAPPGQSVQVREGL